MKLRPYPLLPPPLPGMLFSTLGAGLQSLAGAPRLLAAIGRDKLIPELAMFSPALGMEPRAALVLCASLSLCCIMIGKLAARPRASLFTLLLPLLRPTPFASPIATTHTTATRTT